MIVEKAWLAPLEPFVFERLHMAEAVSCLENAAVNLEMFSIVSIVDMPLKEVSSAFLFEPG